MVHVRSKRVSEKRLNNERRGIYWCTKCKSYHPKSAFQLQHMTARGGLNAWCKECRKRYRNRRANEVQILDFDTICNERLAYRQITWARRFDELERNFVSRVKL